MKRPKLLLAVALVALGCLPAARAASTPIAGRIVLRPLTPTDKTWYGLASSVETSGGLSTVGVGTPAYFEAQASGVVASNTTVSWSITSKPLTSGATLTASPMGANVPIYEPSDTQVLKNAMVGSRVMLRPDMEGQYVVTASITNGTTLKTNVSVTITAASYLGWYNGCIACHSGSAWVLAPNKSSWTNTEHASMFTRGINGDPSVSGYKSSCLSCHTVGYDANTNANAGGFYQQMTKYGWTFPTVLTNGNWASMQSNYPAVANVGNIQCENCHGPGSEHIIFGGQIGNTNTISINWNSGTCDQCHDATTHHIKGTEWRISGHAIAPNQTGATCARCHTAQGFANFVEGAPAVSTAYNPITCSACHDPHDASNPHQLRTVAPVTVGDGVVVTNAGTSAICLECHHSRNGDSAVTNIANYVAGLPTWAGGSNFGTHHGPQGDMFYGSGGYTYGQNIPSSAHRDAIANPCVSCHMQTTPATTDPRFLYTGGHTFNVVYQSGTTNFQMTDGCAVCHGAITNVSLVREDFNGDGVIQDVQTEVQGLLDTLSTMLPPDTTVKSSLSTTTNWTLPQLRAAYNWQFVSEDRSKGIHNVAYAVGLLKASIADLNPDKNNDGIADAWQTQYFGSCTSTNAAPTACPAGDGIPNWVKYALGLNPLIPGVAVPNGVVWANNSGSNTNGPLHIYTAAEVTFPTVVGTTYQIQGISQLNGGAWQNIGGPIQGTGNDMSYLTPTRNDAQQFFRVVHTP